MIIEIFDGGKTVQTIEENPTNGLWDFLYESLGWEYFAIRSATSEELITFYDKFESEWDYHTMCDVTMHPFIDELELNTPYIFWHNVLMTLTMAHTTARNDIDFFKNLGLVDLSEV